MKAADAGSTPSGSGRLYRLFWRWHFLAALLVIPFVLWQSVTGSLYLWSYRLIDLQKPELRFVMPTPNPVPVSQRVKSVLAAYPSSSVSEIQLSEDPQRSTVVVLKGDGGLPKPVFVDPNSGNILGELSSAEWLPGLSRALHGGWPLGKAGSLLLELGDCWAIVMILTGLYLWWPRKIGFMRALWPRTGAGARVFWRDLHACVAAWFSIFILNFLITALPWTSFWGGQILRPLQAKLEQGNGAGFSPGGASGETLLNALPALDQIVQEARMRNVHGTLQLRLAPWPGADWWVHNGDAAPGTDRYLLGDPATGKIKADIVGSSSPLMSRAIDAGVHLHQGDFGVINRWGNTLVALALIWMTVTGLMSWWSRRPKGTLAAPDAGNMPWPAGLKIGAVALCLFLPLLGISVVLLFALDAIQTRIRLPA